MNLRPALQCIKAVQLFSLVVQLFKNIDIGMTKFVYLCKKLYILVEIPLQINFRPKHSVPKPYSFFLWLYSILIIVQLFKNIDMGTTEFV